MRRFLVLTLALTILLAACTTAAPATPTPTATVLPPTDTPVPEPTATPLPSSAEWPWWNQAVFYEVFVRSFADSTTGPLACDGIGDLQGLIENLDYLNDGDPTTTHDLGITALWLMPIKQSPSYHGYDVTDYYTVDSDYGANEDFQRLMDEAHARGIHVIIDLVLNHTSSQHDWFTGSAREDSPTHDYYLWTDDPPNQRGPWGQDVWHRYGLNSYYGLFWSGMPDLNYRNDEVTAYMHDVARFWLDDMGADGFRLDAVRYLIEDGRVLEDTPETQAWLRDFQAVVKDTNPNAFTVGEVWTDTETVVTYVGDEVDIAFDFDQAAAILDALNTGRRNFLASRQFNAAAAFPPNQYATFITNHDQPRVMTEFRGDVDKARVAASILLTSPGVPFIYYGEEIGMVGPKPDEKIRTPLQWDNSEYAGFSGCRPWQAVNPNFTTVNIADQTDDPDSLLSHYRTLIHLRQQHPALLTGEFSTVRASNDGIYAILRHAPEEDILVIFNLTGRAIDSYALELESGPLTDLAGPAELLHGATLANPMPTLNASGGFDNYQPLAVIAPYETYIIRWP